MTTITELAAELISMFAGEKRLTLEVLAVVATTGWLVDFMRLDSILGGVVLLFGCLALLIASVCRSSRARAR